MCSSQGVGGWVGGVGGVGGAKTFEQIYIYILVKPAADGGICCILEKSLLSRNISHYYYYHLFII